MIFHRVKHLFESAAPHSWLFYLPSYMNYTNYVRRESAKSLSHVNLRFKNDPRITFELEVSLHDRNTFKNREFQA